MPHNIGIFYSVTAKSQYQPLSKPKNKPAHPYIMKIMENTPKPVMTKELNLLSMINSKSMLLKHQMNAQIKANAWLEESKSKEQSPTIFSLSTSSLSSRSKAPVQNAVKSFSMNFSQLSTGKPCGSCGGR